jgi:hypothetical protein
MKKLSARHFKDPLILTLGEMSHFTEGYPIYFKDTYAAIAAKMEISLDDYGFQPATGQLWVTQWIGFAFKALRTSNPPMCQQNMKGRWELTEQGLERARVLASQTVSEIEIPEAPDKNEPPPVIEGGVTLNLNVAIAAKAATGYYHTDSYLRGLAINATRCFGNWSAKSTTCKRCPLIQSCKESMAVDLSALSRRLNLIEIEANRPVEETPVEVEETPWVRGSPVPEDSTLEAQLIQNVPVATECYVCNTPIGKGAECYWVKPHGMSHLTCHKAG